MFKRLFRCGSITGRRGSGQGQGRGMGGGNKPGSGPTGKCICPKCGYTSDHKIGERCVDLVCPQCGAKMMRE